MSNKEPITISTHNGSRVCVGHNLRNERSIGNPDIDPTRKHLNETLVFEPIQRAYERIFGQAVKEYNEKQTRPERQIKGYYEKIKEDSKKHPVYEMIIQVGDYHNIGNDNPVAREILKEFIANWKYRNPNLELIGAYIHADEATLHAHLDYIPVATGYVRGMHTQNGLDKALRQQGFDGKTSTLTPQILWEKRENSYLEKLCIEHGFEIIHPERDKIDEEKRVHQSVEEYKTEALANEIDENFIYNQQLQQQNEKLKEKKEKIEKEIADKNIELKKIQGRILTEKGVETFRKNPDKNIFGRVKPVQTINLADYKSLMKTVSKVQDGDKREQQLDEKERKINKQLEIYEEKLRNKEYNLSKREENLHNFEIIIEQKRKKVEQGLYNNTDKRLQAVETELKDIKDFCSKICYKDGSTVLKHFNIHKQEELERQERERDYDYGFSR